MEIQVLGPLSVRVDGSLVRLPAGRTRVVLGVLALHHGEAVSRDRLIDAAWDDRAPATAATQLQGMISALRRCLPDGTIETHGAAYSMRIAPRALDLAVAQAAIEDARAAARSGLDGEAVACYGTVLAAWRGAAFDGLESMYLAGHAARLRELRVSVVEEWARLVLESGSPATVIDELTGQRAADPLRESVSELLMTALYRVGRQADALATFRATRAALHDALGVEPGRAVQDLHRRILAADPSLTPASSAPVVRARPSAAVPLAQLPPDTADFTGRGSHIKHLTDLLARTETGETGGAGAVVLITGIGGVGKTTLAVTIAHRLRDRFSDGQLHVSLHAGTSHPVETCQAAGRILRNLGVEDTAIPADEDELRALYRSAVADRRLLIVLDDARDAAQVRSLLPASGASAVLVTSRNRMPGLPATVRLELETLEPAEAGALFAGIIGPERAAAEPDAVADILAACGYLPLAVRIAASRLATRPDWRVSALADRLADARHRLDELVADDQRARATFEFSYEALSPDQRRTFRLPAIADLDEMSTGAAAALLGLDERTAERLAETLVDMNLLGTVGPGRYRYHDLVRLFAREKAVESETPAVRLDALGRLLVWYHDSTRAVIRAVRPGSFPPGDTVTDFSDAGEARSWLEREHRNVTLTLIQYGELAGIDPEPMARTLDHIQWYLRARGHWDYWEQAARAVLSAAARIDTPVAELTARSHLGQLATLRGDADQARAHLDRALQLARTTGNRSAEAYTLNRLGLHAYQGSKAREACGYHEQALAIFTELDERRGIWTTITNLGKCHRELHQPERALEFLYAALSLARELADPENETVVLHHIACCQSDLGNYDDAVAAHEACLVLIRRLGQREGEAYTLAELGRTHRAAHRPAAAVTHLGQAIDMFRTLGEANAAAVFLVDLGHAQRDAGDEAAARTAWTEALGYFEGREAGMTDALRQALGG